MKLVKNRFSDEFNRSLQNKYKRRVKNSEFATFYNLQFTRSITTETARKWLLGITVPNIAVVKDLANWLNMDLSDLFNEEEN